MASRSSRTRLSEAERAERRQRDRERLKQAAEQLLTSEGWLALGARACPGWAAAAVAGYLGARSAGPEITLSNQLLVAIARPDATFVASNRGSHPAHDSTVRATVDPALGSEPPNVDRGDPDRLPRPAKLARPLDTPKR